MGMVKFQLNLNFFSKYLMEIAFKGKVISNDKIKTNRERSGFEPGRAIAPIPHCKLNSPLKEPP